MHDGLESTARGTGLKEAAPKHEDEDGCSMVLQATDPPSGPPPPTPVGRVDV